MDPTQTQVQHSTYQNKQIPSDNLDGRPSTALKQRRNIKSGLTTVNNNNNQSDQKCMFPEMNQKLNHDNKNFDQRAQSAGGFSKTLQFSNKAIKPQYQELGFQAPQSAKNFQNNNSKLNQPIPDITNKEYKRVIPKSIPQDKEQLYEELLRTKSTVHVLEKENYKLKTRIQFQEKEISKSTTTGFDFNDDIISSTNGITPGIQKNQSMTNFKSINLSDTGSQSQQSQTSLIPNLKKQVKMLNEEILNQKQQMLKIQRNVKLTKISELEVELKTYQDETVRLKQLLQHALNDQNGSNNQNLEEKYINIQNKNIVLQKEAQGYQTEINSLKEEIQNLKNKIKEQERGSYKLTKQKNHLEKINLRKEKDLDRYRTQDPQLNIAGNYKKNQIGQSETQLKQELEKRIIECNQLNTNWTKLKKDFQEYQKQSKQKNYAQEEELKYYKGVVSEQENQIEKSQIELQEYKKKYTQVIGANQQQTNQKKQKSSTIKMASQILQSDDNKFTLEDVQNLVGYDLKYKLQLKKIDSTSFDRYLFNQENLASNNIQAEELLQNLKKDPFLIPEDNRMTILIKYLILDEDERNGSLNLEQGQMTDIVKKRFQEVIFNFKKLKYEDEKLIRQTVYQQVYNNQQTIQGNINQCQLDETGIVDQQVCRRTIFMQALNISGFDSNQIDYIMRRIYQEKKSVDSVQINDFFSLFTEQKNNQKNQNQSQQSINQIKEHQQNDENKHTQQDNLENSQPQQARQKLKIQVGKTVHSNLNDYDSNPGTGKNSINYVNNTNFQNYQQKTKLESQDNSQNQQQTQQQKQQEQQKENQFQKQQQQHIQVGSNQSIDNQNQNQSQNQEQNPKQSEKEIQDIDFDNKLKDQQEKQKQNSQQQLIEDLDKSNLQNSKSIQKQQEPQFTESFKNQFNSVSTQNDQNQVNDNQKQEQNSNNFNTSQIQKSDGLGLEPTQSINMNKSEFLQEQKRQSEQEIINNQNNQQKITESENQELKQKIRNNQDQDQDQASNQKNIDQKSHNNQQENESTEDKNKDKNQIVVEEEEQEGDDEYGNENFENENQDNKFQAHPSQRTEYTNKTSDNNQDDIDDINDEDEIEL